MYFSSADMAIGVCIAILVSVVLKVFISYMFERPEDDLGPTWRRAPENAEHLEEPH